MIWVTTVTTDQRRHMSSGPGSVPPPRVQEDLPEVELPLDLPNWIRRSHARSGVCFEESGRTQDLLFRTRVLH